MAKRSSKEHNEQCALMEWAHTLRGRYPEIRWLHSIPNGAKLPYRKTRGGKRYCPEAMWLKAEGMLNGVSDLHLPVAKGAYHSLWVEMKVGYNKPTESQEEYIHAMNELGHYATTCWSMESAKDVVEEYLSLGAFDLHNGLKMRKEPTVTRPKKGK
jgi:hypothetical protein